MKSIEKISVIDKSRLNEEFYCQSLLEEAYRSSLLTDVDLERIQYEFLELLANRTECYNGQDSSSIRVEVAETIMKSNFYTIGLWLKLFPCADDAVKILKDSRIFDLYHKGLKCIDRKLKVTKNIYRLVIQNKLDTDNYDYNSTIVGGMKGFFKIYNSDYEAHEIHITADYPLCIHIKNLVGIEFIQKYLESIYYENMFCRYFSSDDIHHVLCGYDCGYKDLVINIFEIVLTTAIGCKLAGIDAISLNISYTQIEYLERILSEKSKEDISSMVLKANDDLQNELNIQSKYLQQYMGNSLSAIISTVCNAVKENTLNKVFIVPKYPEQNPKVYFSYGEKMDDEKYRNTISEIKQCRYLSDKIAIIRSKIHSLSDLEDLIFDAELSQSEIMVVLNGLEMIEIAAIAKRHPFVSDIEAVDLSKLEQELRLCLHNYITAQPVDRRDWILNSISLLCDKD